MKPDRALEVVPDRFAGRVTWITGGGAGIGAAVAVRLAREGAAVAVLDVDQRAAEAVAARCADEGAYALAVVADAADLAALERSHEEVVSGVGVVDLLVNNVSAPNDARLLDSDDAMWERVFDVGFHAAVRCARLVLPGMIERRDGAIVNIGSVHGHRGFPGWGAYAAAKGALLAFTRQLAVEVGEHGVRVNAVTPGAVMTELNRRRLAESDDADATLANWLAANPLGRIAEPDEIAAAVAWVGSDEAGFMTGAELVIDGGEAILGG